MTNSDPSKRPIDFDESEWPLVRITFRGTASDDAFDAYLARMSAIVARGDRIATLIDARQAGATPPIQRRKQAAWQERHANLLRKNVAGTAFVIDSPIVRGVLTAILWLAPMPQPHHITASLAEAERWARDKLRAGVSDPARPLATSGR